MTTNELAAIGEVKSALEAIDGLLAMMRESMGPLSRERIQALSIAIALELSRLASATPYLPTTRTEAA